MNHRATYKHNNTILSVIFGLIIFLPLIIGIIQNDKISSQIEKRNLTKFPAIPQNFSDLNKFPGAFNQYYADHFGLRELFTKAYFKIISKINSSSTSDDVTFGQDGWMFLGSIRPGYTRHDDPMGDVTNVNLYSDDELKTFAESITQVKDWLAKKGIAYVYIIAPNKHTVYFDKLPEYISKKNKRSATDQLINYLKSHTEVDVIDLRGVLIEAKKSHQLYYKTDTHWNFVAANIAQFEIMKSIEKMFPDEISASLLPPSQFKPASFNEGDLVGFAKIEKIVEADPQPVFDNTCEQAEKPGDSNFSLSFITECQDQHLKALIFRDSFFEALQPYFSRKFKLATYIPERVNFKALNKYIAINKPDIVIEEVVERRLPYLPKLEQ